MQHSSKSVSVTLWANRLVALIVAALLFTLPWLLDWYCQFRTLLPPELTAITVAFYCCALVVALALWNLDGLLRSIRKGMVFTPDNVRRIGAVSLCCGITALICAVAMLAYYPLVFMTVVMGFLCLVVSVVRQVMAAAVTIREENDLTI